MDSLIGTFHIDVKLLIAQIINFAIVFGVLYFFALKPLLKVMGSRTEKIEKSLEDAKKIEERLANTEKECGANLAKAQREASEILDKASEQSEENKKEMIKNAKNEIGKVIEQEKAKMQTEKEKTLKEIKSEVAGLIVASLEKILDEKVDSKKDKEMIEKMVKKIGK